MTALLGIREAPPIDEYPPLRLVPARVPETLSLPVVRAEACACGTWVTQHVGEGTTEAVSRHNATGAHRAWREQREA